MKIQYLKLNQDKLLNHLQLMLKFSSIMKDAINGIRKQVQVLGQSYLTQKLQVVKHI